MSTLPGRCSHGVRSHSFHLVVMLCLVVITVEPAPAQDSSANEYSDAMAEGKLLYRQGRLKAAIASYNKANELAAGKCVPCLLTLAILYNQTGSFKEAAECARQVTGLTEEPRFAARAYQELGIALHVPMAKGRIRKTNKKTALSLQEAEVALRRALEIEEGDGSRYFLLANVVADQMVRWQQWNRHQEIKALSHKYLDFFPNGPYSDWAREAGCWIEPAVGEAAPSSAARVETEAARRGEPPAAEGVTHFVEGDVIKPIKISVAQPQYGQWARKSRIQGVVILQAIIDKRGNVANVKILKGLPLCLSEQAIKAVRQWKFQPASLNGEPVDVYYNLTINFRLE